MKTITINWYTFEEKMPEADKRIVVYIGDNEYTIGRYEAKKSYVSGDIRYCIYVPSEYDTVEVSKDTYWTYEKGLIGDVED